MANIKDFIKKIGNEAVSLEEQQQALAQVEQTIVNAKAKREESIGKNVDLVISALKTIESKLEAKLVELNNTPAKQGVQGATGVAGKDGLNGKDGRDGVSGKDGVDGKDGVNGQDGISVVDAKIDFDGSLVVYLSNGAEIDCGQVLSPDVAQNIIINSGGSGTSQSVTDTLASLQTQINTLTGIDGILGTMAQQDANAVAITGGTINNTTIGATTPSTVNATTLSGETARLNGTGQNLILQSQTFNTTWNNQNLTIATSATTAPDSTNTGNSLIPTVSNAIHRIQQSFTWTQGVTYTVSIYAKANGYRYLFLNLGNPFAANNTFDLQTGTVVTASGGTASIVDAGNGWYRCIVVGTPSTTNTNNFNIQVNNTTSASDNTFAGDGISGVFLWGAQVEVSNTVGTYIPTTTTAVYGTPTLSFSGVSTIGLQSNGALFLQPAGTGAIQAQATTSTTAGGNVRGARAVDWQLERGAAGQVASSTYSTIAGGYGHTASGFASVVSGGYGNTASNTNAGVFTGGSNTASGYISAVVTGQSNTSAGYYNFIGGGFTNSGTSGSAVTTQSGTMNATTAVTLSGSNANIKVGQYITGTSIAAETYVAAISGTALTLSKNASGSSTSTLSFFTPHGVVVGGGNNQATGSYSFIGGGGDAGTAANRNVASGDWSFVGGGTRNTASGAASFLGGGGYDGGNTSPNTASGAASFLGGGLGNTSAGYGSVIGGGASNQCTTGTLLTTVCGGSGNIANANYSAVMGGSAGTTRSIQGNHIFSASINPISSTAGTSQTALLVLATQTTDATATALRSSTAAAGTTNQVILPNNSAYFFTGEVVSGVTGGGNTKGWTIEGVIKRGANAAATTLVGSSAVSAYGDAGAATWAIALTADTTNGGLRVTFTGQAATTIRTVARINTVEMTF